MRKSTRPSLRLRHDQAELIYGFKIVPHTPNRREFDVADRAGSITIRGKNGRYRRVQVQIHLISLGLGLGTKISVAARNADVSNEALRAFLGLMESEAEGYA